MEHTKNKYHLREVITSFKYWPRIFKMLWNINKQCLLVILILSFISSIIPTISMILTQSLINAIQTSGSRELKYILTPFILYIIVNLCNSVIKQVTGYFQNLFKLKINYKISLMILKKVKTLSLDNFEDSQVYDKLRRAEDESGERPYTVFILILSVISQVITLVGTIGILLIWKPWIILCILIVPIMSSMCTMKLGYLQYMIHRKRAPKQRKSWYFNYILTTDIAFKEIKLYELADYFINEFKKLNKEFIYEDKKIIAKQTKLSVIFELLDEFIGGIVCFLVIRSAYIGEILLGNTITYIRCISNIQSYTQGVLGVISSMCENNLYLNQLFEFLDLEEQEDKSIPELEEINQIDSIEFKNVFFKYPHRKEYTLSNINFKINKGERIALVGENGSGKTTLVKLICGFYDNYEGKILINGISMKKVKKDSIYKKIGTVFQDYNKYELTCRENVGLGRLSLIRNDFKLLKSIKKASADTIVEALSNGLDTQLGVWFDDGVQLSGGQWQKLALARSFLREADCYILDEPSASLDSISEYEIFTKLYKLTKDKIGIFITHRLFNIKKIASQIYVLNKGKLIEMGTHEELMRINSHYKYLYNLQNLNKQVKEDYYING